MNFAKSASHMHQMASAVLHHEKSVTHEMASPETIEHEKQFVAHFAENQQEHPLAPDEIMQNSRNKELGHSSKGLSVRDFDLVRTLGTGTCLLLVLVWCDLMI
jgi:protein kinase A